MPIDNQKGGANREVLSYALELAANPAVVFLLFPSILQLVNGFA